MYVDDQLFKSSSFPTYNLLHVTDVSHLQSQNYGNLKAERNPVIM